MAVFYSELCIISSSSHVCSSHSFKLIAFHLLLYVCMMMEEYCLPDDLFLNIHSLLGGVRQSDLLADGLDVLL